MTTDGMQSQDVRKADGSATPDPLTPTLSESVRVIGTVMEELATFLRQHKSLLQKELKARLTYPTRTDATHGD